MALINCPECNKQVSEKAATCPACGCPLTAKTNNANLVHSQSNNYIKKDVGILEAFAGYSLVKKLVCPHCQKYGCVITKPTKQKKGISGGKATGAILTAGWSLLATGLSRKEKLTEAICKNCKIKWYF